MTTTNNVNPYFIDNYNEEILKDIRDDGNLTICASLGSGKSTSVKKYIHTSPFAKILLVVNKVDDIYDYAEDLENNIIPVEAKSRLKLKEAVEKLDSERFNCVAITKVRFNYMVTVNTKIFDDFTKIIVDESGGLNPIIQDKFERGLENILTTLGKVLVLMNKDAYIKGKKLLDFLYGINQHYIKKDSVHRMIKLKIENEHINLALDLKNHLMKLYEEDKLNEHDVQKVFGLLNNIVDNKLYINEYNKIDKYDSSKKKASDMLFCNNFLKDYIRERKNVSFKVLDGTANFIKDLYSWLEIPIKDSYESNLKEYPNVKLHNYKFSDLSPFKGRTDEQIQEKMRDYIERLGIDTDVLLFTNNASSKIFKEKYHRTEYAFGGKDVGSNEFRHDKELAVVFYNTMPQSFRLMWNKEIRGLDMKEASSAYELEMAEYQLVGSMMVQLVGRTAIREDNNNEVNIYMFCVPRTTTYSIKQHYKIPDENIITYDATLDLRKKTTLAFSGLMYILRLDMENKFSEIDVKKKISEYYGENEKKDTSKNIRKNNLDKLHKLGDKFGYDLEFVPRKHWKFIKK